MKFCLLSTYSVKGRGTERNGGERAVWEREDLGLGPGPGSVVAPSPLQLLTGFPSDPSQRFEAGIKEAHAKAPQSLASPEHSGCSNCESVPRAVPTFRNSEVDEKQCLCLLPGWFGFLRIIIHGTYIISFGSCENPI